MMGQHASHQLSDYQLSCITPSLQRRDIITKLNTQQLCIFFSEEEEEDSNTLQLNSKCKEMQAQGIQPMALKPNGRQMERNEETSQEISTHYNKHTTIYMNHQTKL
eukprot:TRINITY_DN4644_c1_g2_i1.p3 TRINITY_DN4644_c1_g2~~TRINITY_DN4644_c1_g2_i1.p3  ORF type:complete len:106 (+),score=3.26 TRINITY_DN4644_c1_g2_i1:1-318(+)